MENNRGTHCARILRGRGNIQSLMMMILHKYPYSFLYIGGSNNQVSHHLFPGIASTNLPKIVPILRETCKEFGVQYHCLASPLAAAYGHISQLHWLGSGPKKL